MKIDNPPKAGEYKCVVVDPPWDQPKFIKRDVRPNQSDRLPYDTMTQQEIADIPISSWADDQSCLWVWATNSKSESSGKPILVQAFELLEHWGFTYHTVVTWDKGTGVCPFSPYQITTEHCVFGYRGKFQFPKKIFGKMKTGFHSRVTGHSEKPVFFYKQLVDNFPEPRLDVFARKRHLGFDVWGNETSDFYETTPNEIQMRLL